MTITCFECAAQLHAADPDAAERVFLEHARERHSWTYPEQGLRNYARNCAEAGERLTGSTERQAEIGAITIEPVTEARIDVWLQLFDHDGFAGNPDWASCYCLTPHLPATPEEPERPWRDTRAAMVARLRSGTAVGYLAYVDGRAAGWVNASLRADYGLFRTVDPGGPPPASVVGVSCFVIAPPYRRHGVASALLDRVIADAPARGATWIEGYPHNTPDAGDPGHFRGPRVIYETRGFVPVEAQDQFTVMRRRASSAT